MAKKKDDISSITMAQALAGGTQDPEPAAAATPAEPAPEKPKRRRRSVIERDPMPELPKKKRTRRKKDPALKKSHTFTLLMTESLYERFRLVAEAQGFSMNGIATRLIKKYVSLHDIDGDDLGL